MKKAFFLILIFQWILTTLHAQEFSQHFYEQQLHKNTPTTPELIGDRSQPILPLQQRLAKTAVPEVTVFGYLPSWIRSQAYENLRFDLLTHIAVFSIEVNADGSFGNKNGWPWNDVINKAHSAGVKVILTMTLFNGSEVLTLITNTAYKQRFFENVKAEINAGHADGVNIDFESGHSTGWPAKINAFMAELTDYLHREIPGSEVSFAAPIINWNQDFDLPGLAQSCDYLFIMGYAFAGGWSSTTGPNSPFTGPGYNISSALNSDYALAIQNAADRLILGLPYYGHEWKTTTQNAGATITEFIASRFFSSAQPGSEAYGLLWDQTSQTPWYRFNDGDS
ncbi:glycoside hydrolase family 18 protein [candidate division KSB1 bacterium]|nr:glycoside hydrolase family 18 protein [candidate division KSB1 bacterium]